MALNRKSLPMKPPILRRLDGTVPATPGDAIHRAERTLTRRKPWARRCLVQQLVPERDAIREPAPVKGRSRPSRPSVGDRRLTQAAPEGLRAYLRLPFPPR